MMKILTDIKKNYIEIMAEKEQGVSIQKNNMTMEGMPIRKAFPYVPIELL